MISIKIQASCTENARLLVPRRSATTFSLSVITQMESSPKYYVIVNSDTGKGHYTASFRSLFDDVPIRIRRLLTCPYENEGEAKSFAALDLEAAIVAPTAERSADCRPD